MGKSSTSGCTGGYSYWALSEPFVIIPDVQIYCIKTRDDSSSGGQRGERNGDWMVIVISE